MPFVALRRRVSYLGVLLPELVVVLFAGVAVLLYREFALPLRSPWGLYWSRIQGTIPCYGVSLLLALLYLRLVHLRQGRKHRSFVPHRFTWEKSREVFFHRRSVLEDLRLLNITCVMFVVFVNLKHLIPYVNPMLFDEQVSRLDIALFRGRFAGEVLHEWLGIRIAPLLSGTYTLFYPYVAAVIYIFVMQRNRLLAYEFLTGFFLLWFLGLCFVYLIPTWGPIFFAPELYSGLPFTEVTDMQQKLWRHKLVLDQFPAHPAATFLISGLPSLHLAVPVYSTFYLLRVHWTLAVVSLSFIGVTAITTIYFGWHWVADDIVAILFGAALARSNRRYFAPRYIYVPEKGAAQR